MLNKLYDVLGLCIVVQKIAVQNDKDGLYIWLNTVKHNLEQRMHTAGDLFD